LFEGGVPYFDSPPKFKRYNKSIFYVLPKELFSTSVPKLERIEVIKLILKFKEKFLIADLSRIKLLNDKEKNDFLNKLRHIVYAEQLFLNKNYSMIHKTIIGKKTYIFKRVI